MENNLFATRSKSKKDNKTKIIIAICCLVVSIIIGCIIGIFIAQSPQEDPGCLQHGPSDDKPVIYLYPETTIDAIVTLGRQDLLTASYPYYKESWQVTANPDGTLIDKKTGRELYSLYYESQSTVDFDKFDNGFLVKGEDSASFLEDKLAKLGLNYREAEEFIIYWLPILESAPYNLIRFASSDEIEKNMPLAISPSPDTIIRVLLIFKPLENLPESIPREQVFETPSRTGFSVVEWGGIKL